MVVENQFFSVGFAGKELILHPNFSKLGEFLPASFMI